MISSFCKKVFFLSLLPFALCAFAEETHWVRLQLDSGSIDRQPWRLDDYWEYGGVSQTLSMVREDGGWVSKVDYSFDSSVPGSSEGEVRLIRSIGSDKVAGISFEAGTTNPEMRLSARLADADGRWHEVDLKFEQNGRWTRFVIPFRTDFFPLHWGGPRKGSPEEIKLPMIHVMLLVRKTPKATSAKGELLLRNFSQLVDGGDVSPARLVGISVENDAPAGIAFAGEKAALRVAAVNRTAEPQSGTIRLRWIDDEGKTGEESASFSFAGQGEGSVFTFPMDCSEPRFFTVSARIEQEGRETASCESALAVVQRPDSFGKPEPEAFFGLMGIQTPDGCARIGAKNERVMLRTLYGSSEKGRRESLMRADKAIAEARSRGENVVATLNISPRNMPVDVGWNEPADILTSSAVRAYWQEQVGMIAKRYRGKLIGIELINEPDNQIWHARDYPLDKAAAAYALMLKLGREAVHKVAPELPVIGLDVSGRDFNELKGRPKKDFPGDFTFIKAVLDREPGVIDICGAHPYSHNRFMGEGRRIESPEEFDIRTMMTRVGDLLEERGCPRRIWSTELGWAILRRPEPLDAISRLYAATVAQSFTLARTVPGLEKLFWFTDHRHADFEAQYYDLFRCNHFVSLRVPFNVDRCTEDIYPSLAAAVYASSAYMLDKTVFLKELKKGPGVSAWLFEHKPSSDKIIVFWSRRDGRYRLAATMPESATAVNAVGRTVAAGGAIDVDFDRLPVFLRIPSGEADAVEKGFLAGKVVDLNPVNVKRAFFGSPSELRVVAVNAAPAPIDATFSLGGTMISRKLRPGEQRLVLPLQAPVKSEQSIRLELATSDARIAAEIDGAFLPIPYMADPVIDGNLAEVSGLAPLRCSDRVHLFPPDAPWKGPEDLSVEAWFAWNEKGLYFAARVRDDKHCVSGEQPDSVLFSFDWEGWAGDGYDENCREVGLADGKGGPYAWMVQKGTEPVPLVPAPVVRRIGSETMYEAFFPWRNLKIPEPKAGKIISANFVVNDNDGSGGKFRMGFVPGSGVSGMPVNYRKFIFLKNGK